MFHWLQLPHTHTPCSLPQALSLGQGQIGGLLELHKNLFA
jgi:hypothetical protein